MSNFFKLKSQKYFDSCCPPSYFHTLKTCILNSSQVLFVSVCQSLQCRVLTLVFLLQPLNPNPDSRWNTYFKDNEILLQIDKDVRWVFELFVLFFLSEPPLSAEYFFWVLLRVAPTRWRIDLSIFVLVILNGGFLWVVLPWSGRRDCLFHVWRGNVLINVTISIGQRAPYQSNSSHKCPSSVTVTALCKSTGTSAFLSLLIVVNSFQPKCTVLVFADGCTRTWRSSSGRPSIPANSYWIPRTTTRRYGEELNKPLWRPKLSTATAAASPTWVLHLRLQRLRSCSVTKAPDELCWFQWIFRERVKRSVVTWNCRSEKFFSLVVQPLIPPFKSHLPL